ncbi:MAG: ATP-binding cassette domain-containing protein [Firmicutes bacterium]|nr:ATP-binding cassette domain-containing protein [Bacillota bacterium]
MLNNISERIIEIKGVTKKFGDIEAVNNVTLSIKKGEFVTLLGPSGCGKTTLLRMIAGFDAPTSGTITFNDMDLKDIPPHLRSVNTVFQRYALFPHLNVYNNIAFGLKLKKIPKTVTQKDGTTAEKLVKYTSEEINKKVKGALKLVELSGYEHRDVNSLSGGQQQRVAIARAIVNEPLVLLLDEPLGALDLKMRKEMQLELKEMHKKLGITFIYVTHDQEEALTMSDTIVVMKNGIIQQTGTGLEIYNEPLNAFVANFIGESNILNGKITGEDEISFDEKVFECKTSSFRVGQSVDVVIRPEDIVIKKVDQEKISSGRYFEGTVVSSVFKGTYYEMGVKSNNGCEYLVQSTSHFDAEEKAMLRIESGLIHLMKKERFNNKFVTTLKNNENVTIYDVNVPCDITKLSGITKNADGYFVDEKQESVDLSGKDVIASIENKDIILRDHDAEGQFSGEIVSILFKGDHYYVEVKTDYNQFFYVETNDIWDDGDRVGIELPAEKIKLKFPEIEDL